MSDTLRAACVQVNSSADKDENLETTAGLVAQAAARGAEVVLLPEKWNARGTAEVNIANAEGLDSGRTVDAMRAWAREHRITLIGGSICELREGQDKPSNTSLVFDPDGEISALYRKIHLFDVDVGGEVHRESDSAEPGDEPVLCDIRGWQVGLTVCYDLRFPELYRLLTVQGAEILTVPAAFTSYTGKDHWELLLRARAVENQCYVLAADEWGNRGSDGGSSYGRSMIVDPWGVVLAQAGDEDCVIVADLDRERLTAIRASLPSLRHRQPVAYEQATVL